MGNDIDAVIASYHRCRASEGFVDTFYERFLGRSPEVAAKFRNTDFQRQKLMLRESLLAMLTFNLGYEQSRAELERLGERHSRSGVDIPPRLYSFWLDALCEAVADHDPQYTAELGDKWRAAMLPGIELIRSRY